MTPLSGVAEEDIGRAMSPRLEFGRGLLHEGSLSWGLYMLVTMPEVWTKVKDMIINPPQHVHLVTTMDETELKRIEALLPPCDLVVGIGGGASLDMAKYVAWMREEEPILVPSIASADACVTNTIAVRVEKKVRYVGFVVPKVVISDFELMSAAPPALNRAGIGDILSIHTGCFDWGLSAREGMDGYDPEAAARVQSLVRELEERINEVRDVTDEALRWLIEAYAEENAVCLAAGHSRPEEGSEHFFAYNVEAKTGRGFVHGELVCLGILLMSRLQENDPERIERILEQSGVRYQPRDLGLTREEVEYALITLPEYVEAEKLPYSIVNQRSLDAIEVDGLLSGLEF